MRVFLPLLLLMLTSSCANHYIKYNRLKMLEKYATEYQLFVDNQKMDLETVFLDKDNIQSIHVDKRTKELKIIQYKPSKLFEIKELSAISLSSESKDWGKNKVALIVIDGVPLSDELKQKIKIDPNAIKSFTIINQEKIGTMNLCRAFDGIVILIATK